MKGDFSRFTFNARKHFTRVLKQQGRVELDADWNEHEAIQAYLREAGLADVIGQAGTPDNGFLITALDKGKNFQIGAGCMVVDGIRVENDGVLTYDKQPNLPLPGEALQPPAANAAPQPAPANADQLPPLPTDGLTNPVLLRTDLVYLDVWDQHVTALEDASLLEVALGGPDTATRVETRWRVRWMPDVTARDCDDDVAHFPPAALGTGKLSTLPSTVDEDADPCIVEPDRGGYRDLENRLYRVEIHKDGTRGTATFKWSSENGAVVYAVAQVTDNHRLKVKRLGRDEVLRLKNGDAVEIYSADDVRLGRAGILTTIDGAPNDLEIKLTADITPYITPQNAPNPVPVYLRRWDEIARDLDRLDGDGEIKLGESGIRVEFTDGTYRVGDYWTFAARARTGTFDLLNRVAPHGVAHHYARLALVYWWRVVVGGKNVVSATVADCRPYFPPLTQLTQLHYVGGDGQEARPSHALPRPLVVRVSNGAIPVKGVPVRFMAESGVLQANPNPDDGEQFVPTPFGAFVLTGERGLASVMWMPDASIYSQQVIASLWDADHLQVRFNANLSIASEVAYTPADDCDLEATTVQAALDALCRRRADSEPGIRITGIYWDRDVVIDDDTHSDVEPELGVKLLALFEVERSDAGKATALNLREEFVGRVSVAEVLDQVRGVRGGRATPRFISGARASENRITLGGNTMAVATLDSALDDLSVAVTPGTVIPGGVRTVQQEPVVNDTAYPITTFSRGLLFTLDREVSPLLVSRATCYLTSEMPGSSQADAGGFFPFVLRALEGYPQVNGNEIRWYPSDAAKKSAAVGARLARALKDKGLLVRITLKGNFIHSVGDPRDNALYLDGEAFGVKDFPPHDLLVLGKTKDGDAIYSGDERRGGDFEMWFWVTLTGDEPATGQDDIGFVLANADVLRAELDNVLSVTVDRPKMEASGLLPAGYAVDPNVPFDLAGGRRALRELGHDFVPLDEATGANLVPRVGYVQSLEEVVRTVIQPTWRRIIGTQIAYDAIPDADFVAKVAETPYALIICRRSQLDSVVAEGLDRYDLARFTVI